MDEMKRALNGKTSKNLDGMIKSIDSSFTYRILEFPLP